MKVRAIREGFYGGSRRRVGAIFDVADGAKGRWFVPAVAAPAEPEAAPKPAKGAKAGKAAPTEAPPGGSDRASDQDVI